MTGKIYEYKDDQDWYVGNWQGHNFIVGMGEIAAHDLLPGFSSIVEGELEPYSEEAWNQGGYDVHIIRYSSMFRLVTFIVEIINENMNRNIEVLQRQGAILVAEDGRLLYVHVPKGGVVLQDFLGQEKVRDTLLIATRNEGKTAEFRKMFDKLGLDVENLNDYPDLPDVAETGMTFEENARLKAETIAKLTGKMVLADDSGLKVDVLGGLPGVWSARFAGNNATDAENNAKLRHELAMVFDKKNRSAQFHTTLVVASPDRDSLVVEADWEGYIAFEPKGENGFGYDSLFLIGESEQTAAELSLEEKNEQSHRAKAVKKLVEVFPAWQSKPSL
ncbi:nucleoside-triphosphate diphosphatase [Streptococcus himalayensis]|uniref:dITP/XTP pyrophosphatase n=1 Tax=Streptococcus himalayensis TaxID=1888195 RepID=A0A917EHQ0_9STRE|nr:nucleoside-triphosphate diphosphatase [Streptococcus himalayensis]GGE37406.1 non-canonical purine NTP pyrophosphatase [Streptococcus himalayensis]